MSRRRVRRRSAKSVRHAPRSVVREATYIERLAYTRSQAAEALGISRSTLIRRVLPHVDTIEMPWGAKLIPVDELERLLQERRRRFAAALVRVPAPRAEDDFAGYVNDRLDDEQQMHDMLLLFRRLPKREQDVFILCAWFGLSYEDAASALAIPVGTVRSRLSRARARLRELGPRSGHEHEDQHEAEQVLP